jgi:hypothetical protein
MIDCGFLYRSKAGELFSQKTQKVIDSGGGNGIVAHRQQVSRRQTNNTTR